MRLAIITLFLLNYFVTSTELEEFSDDPHFIQQLRQSPGRTIHSEISASPDVIAPEIIPANEGIVPGIGKKNNFAVNCDLSTNYCPGYCQQLPQLCSSPCKQSTKTVKIKVPVTVSKTISEKVIRAVAKHAKYTKVPKTSDVVKECPQNYKLFEDENDIERCVEAHESSISCPNGFEYKNDVCVKTTAVCANEYTTVSNKCLLRVVCPLNYKKNGDICAPHEPQCPFGWYWTGHACEPEKLTCPRGYTLTSDNKCKHEEQRCLPGYKDIGGHCIKDDPRCPYGFTMNIHTKVCEKFTEKCPPGSFDMYNECVNISYDCPVGAEESGSICTYEQVVPKVVYETEYFDKTATIPGPVGYECASTGCPNTNGCFSTC